VPCGLATADGHHDFELIAIRKELFAEPAARHDLAVALERDALARQLESAEQLGTVERLLEYVAFAVDGE